jgi:hypothetical protein
VASRAASSWVLPVGPWKLQEAVCCQWAAGSWVLPVGLWKLQEATTGLMEAAQVLTDFVWRVDAVGLLCAKLDWVVACFPQVDAGRLDSAWGATPGTCLVIACPGTKHAGACVRACAVRRRQAGRRGRGSGEGLDPGTHGKVALTLRAAGFRGVHLAQQEAWRPAAAVSPSYLPFPGA